VSDSRFAIKHENGTYFRTMTGIGPAFGADEANAQLFNSEGEANRVILRGGWKFFDTEVVEFEVEDVSHER
jgi:hypothetical protein